MTTKRHIDTEMASSNMLSKLLLLFFLIVMSVFPSFSQKQVTIDRTQLAQDRSKKPKHTKKNTVRHIAQTEHKNETASGHTSSSEHKKKKKTRHRKESVVKRATYLYVNNYSSNVVLDVPYYATNNRLYVTTDGKSFYTSMFPVWCSIYGQYSNSLDIQVSENYSYEERTDWFYINSDSKSVKVTIRQGGKPVNVSASLNNIYVDHNLKKNGTEYLKVSGMYNVYNGSGLTFYAVVFIKTSYGSYMQASQNYPEYRQNDGTFAAVAQTVSLGSDTQQSFNIEIPNNAIYAFDTKSKDESGYCRQLVLC